MAHYLVYNTSDANRQTDTALPSNGTLIVGTIPTEQEGIIAGTVKSDQSGNLFVDQGFANGDGTVEWDYSSSAYAVTGGTGVKVSESIVAPFARVRYVNGASAQAFLRIFIRSYGTKTG